MPYFAYNIVKKSYKSILLETHLKAYITACQSRLASGTCYGFQGLLAKGIFFNADIFAFSVQAPTKQGTARVCAQKRTSVLEEKVFHGETLNVFYKTLIFCLKEENLSVFLSFRKV